MASTPNPEQQEQDRSAVTAIPVDLVDGAIARYRQLRDEHIVRLAAAEKRLKQVQDEIAGAERAIASCEAMIVALDTLRQGAREFAL